VVSLANATAVRALLRAGDNETPILLWKHFRSDDAGELARLTVTFYRDYRLAAAKVMPDIPVLFHDFALSSWSQVAQLRRFGPIETVGRAPEYIRAVQLARAKLDDSDVLMVTVFSPLALVALWCGPRALREMVDGSRAEAHSVLAALGGVVSSLAERCVAVGANGVYYSCWGQDVLSADEYREFGVPYDLAGLRGAEAADVRFLHVHGALNEGTERYADYPVEVVGWSEVDSRVSLSEGAQLLPDQVVMGGISERALGKPDADAVRHIAQLVEALGPRFIAGPGCSLPDEIDAEGLSALRALVPG
jgi:uroporphyrinogen decarboxylase